MDDSNVTLSPVRWYHPNNMRILLQRNSPTGTPYFMNKNGGRLATLVIPTFSDSYDGTYTCGLNNNYPPNPMTTIDLSLVGKKLVAS